MAKGVAVTAGEETLELEWPSPIQRMVWMVWVVVAVVAEKASDRPVSLPEAVTEPPSFVT